MDDKKAGRYYWGIHLDAPPQDIMAFADSVRVTDNGDLLLIGTLEQPVLIYAAGTWSHVWAASINNDGQAIAIEHVIILEEES